MNSIATNKAESLVSKPSTRKAPPKVLMLAEKFGKYSDYASVVLRVALGAVLFWHGQAKILDLAGTAGFLAQSFPAPMLLAVIAAVIETFGRRFF